MSDNNDPRVDRKAALRPPRPPLRPSAPSGTPATGQIVKLLVGQGHGFIRLPNEREVFFHRADVQEGTAFNDLHIGHQVEFALLDDPVSGPRALHVRLKRRYRRA